MVREKIKKEIICPRTKVDAVIDSDAYNEIDDLYALSYLLRSDEKINTRAIIAAPFHSPSDFGRVRQTSSAKEGMQQSYQAIEELLELMSLDEKKKLLFKGVEASLRDESTPLESSGVEELIRLAREHTKENPLYVIGIAVLTDIASALLIAPDIIEKVIIVWLGGHDYGNDTAGDFNTIQDIAAARVVFGSGVSIVHLPCRNVVSHLTVTKEDLDKNLSGTNVLCDFLVETTVDFMHQKMKSDNWIKPLWDVSAVAWLISTDYMSGRMGPSPIFEYDNRYSFSENRPYILTIVNINREKILDDLYSKLRSQGGC